MKKVIVYILLCVIFFAIGFSIPHLLGIEVFGCQSQEMSLVECVNE